VAETLEAISPNIAQTQPELLAHHYTEAGLTQLALDYWQRAGKRALERSALADAISHVEFALRLLPDLADKQDQSRREIRFQNTLGTASMQTRGYAAPETGKAFRRALELCESLNDTDEIFPVLFGLEAYHVVQAEFSEAWDYAKRFHQLAQDLDDPALEVIGLHLMGLTPWMRGQLHEAKGYWEEMWELRERTLPPSTAARFGEESHISGRTFLALILYILGYPEQAARIVERVLADGRALAHANSHAVGLIGANYVAVLSRDMPWLKTLAQELKSNSDDQKLPFQANFSRIFLGRERAETGDLSAGLRLMSDAIEELGEPVGPVQGCRGFIAELQIRNGDYAAARHQLEMERVLIDRYELGLYEAENHRLMALLVCAEGNTKEAEEEFERALVAARAQDARWFELRAARDLARLWRDHGKTAEARELLAPVYDWFTEGFDTADLKDAKALLDELDQ